MKVLFTRGTTLKWGSISILRSFLKINEIPFIKIAKKS